MPAGRPRGTRRQGECCSNRLPGGGVIVRIRAAPFASRAARDSTVPRSRRGRLHLPSFPIDVAEIRHEGGQNLSRARVARDHAIESFGFALLCGNQPPSGAAG
jgi:hypothetical protein